MKRNLWIASDSTKGADFTIDTDTDNILEIAQKYGRAETGEVVTLSDESGNEIATAGWDNQYRKYRKRVDGCWI